MRLNEWSFWQRGVFWGAGFLIAGILGVLLLAYSGFYSVAASRGHPAWLNWFLETGMRQSVQFNSGEFTPPPLDDQGLIALGAGHFQGNCAACHGAPGEPVNPTYDHMLPSPPKLADYADRWNDEELHWISLHGIQYAGMPAWPAEGREDEVWTVVAFLRILPDLDPARYVALANGNAALHAQDAAALTNQGRMAANLTACARCHDTPDAAPTSSHTPRLAGQSAAYLRQALVEYRNGLRQSGFMAPVAAELDEKQIDLLSDYYASISSPPFSTPTIASTQSVQRGAQLVAQGDPSAGIPPCAVCHGHTSLEQYPRLAGQPAEYLKAQLFLWQRGGRAQSGAGKLMADIANRMTEEQIKDSAAFYDSLGRMPRNGASDAPATTREGD